MLLSSKNFFLFKVEKCVGNLLYTISFVSYEKKTYEFLTQKMFENVPNVDEFCQQLNFNCIKKIFVSMYL